MKYKALVSFAGSITMAINEVRELSDKEAAPLLEAKYIEKCKAEKTKE